MRPILLVLGLTLFLCSACSRQAGMLHRPLPADVLARTGASLVPVVQAESPAAAAQVQALLRLSLDAAGRLAPSDEGPRLEVRVLDWKLDPAARIIEREYWADDGGPTRRAVEPLVVREVHARLEAQVVAADGVERTLDPVSIDLPVQVGGGRDETIRLRYAVGPVTLLRGREAGVREAAMRRAIAAVVLQVMPIERGEAIPLAAGTAAQVDALRLARAGELRQAEILLRAAVQVAPQEATAAYNLAAVLDAQGRWSEALQWYGQALALRPDDRWRAVAAACEAAAAE